MVKTSRVKLNDVEIFNAASILEAKSSALVSENKKVTKYLTDLEKRGCKRILKTYEDGSIDKLEALKDKFPNFTAVLDFVIRNVRLAAVSDPNYIKIPPIALGGAPGIGKTQFCYAVSGCLNLELQVIDCSTNNTEFDISGLDSGYNTGKAGLISEFFRTRNTANPLIILDEFEKPSPIPRSSGSNDNFHGPFLTLIEKKSSSEFTDNFSKVKLNASYINWIASVNEFHLLPPPIQSRFTYFEIHEPNQEQRINVCRSIYANLRTEFAEQRKIKFSEKLTDDVVSLLAKQNPREMRKTIEQVMINAATRDFKQTIQAKTRRTKIHEIDATHLANQITPVVAEKPKRGIGFLASIS